MLRARGARCATARACMIVSLGSLSACLIDKDDRCGPNMELREGLCMCVEGATISSNQCVFVDAGGPPPPSGPGALCNANMPCTGTDAPECQMSGTSDGYCTTIGCTATANCPTNFVCVTGASPTYCRKPYTGQGMACTGEADCAQYDATFCSQTYMICLVPGCTADSSCDPGFVCFDASVLRPGAPKVCIPAEAAP